MKKILIKLRQYNSKVLLVMVLAVSTLATAGSVLNPQVAYAWCDNLSIDYENVCVSQNYDSLPQSVKDNTSKAEYIELAETCMNGNAAGWDLGIRQGGCADAAKSCLEHALDVSKVCTQDTMSQMVGGLAVEGGCNKGKLYGDGFSPLGQATCDRLKNANQAVIDERTKAIANKAANACVANGSEEEKTRAKEACSRAITDSCSKPTLDLQGRLKNKDDYTKYEQCIDEAFYKKAANKEECMEKRGGIWLDKPTQDPNGPNKLEAGCFKEASDLTNPEACKAGAAASGKKYEWKQKEGANTPNDKSDDNWGCVDPDNPDGEKDPEKDPDADCLRNGAGECIKDSPFDKVNGECGEARTNIISCGKEGSTTALNNVLRIFVIVLSFGVGIAAVGGLAYSAIQYAGASDDQSSVSAARERIRNIVIGLLLYGFIVAISNFLIPGGIL